MTVSVQLNKPTQETERTHVPWNQLLATISLSDLRRLALEVWIARRHIKDPALKTWLSRVQRALPTVPGFRPGHYERLPGSYIAAPLALFCLRHAADAARLVACWMTQQDHLLAQLQGWCADLGTYFIKPEWIDVDKVDEGYIDAPPDSALAQSLANDAVPTSDLWRYQIAARWINSYFPLQDARQVENATRVATILATQQTPPDAETEKADSPPDSDTHLTQLGRHVIPPEKRGGRPRGTSNVSFESDHESSSRDAMFSIMARREGMVWRLYLETSMDDEAENRQWIVQQGERALALDPRTPNQWLLTSLEDVQVDLGEATRTIALRWLANGLLAFRLSQRDVGRMVSAPSHGAYLLLAPADWEPAMHCYRAKEPSIFAGYAAFFVNLTDQVSQIAFNTSQAAVAVNAAVSRFWCAGECAAEGNADRPSIYLDAPPRLVAFNAADWLGISSVVIVEEGRDVERRRRFTFHPIAGKAEQTLDCLRDVQGGWFSVRLYAGAEFVDSITFRFARGLQSLTVETDCTLPQVGRQAAARITASYVQGIRLVPPVGVAGLVVHADETHLFAELPDNVGADAGEWHIVLQDGSVIPITLKAKRVWWTLSEKAPETYAEWGCAVPTLNRDAFRASNRTHLWVKAPHCEFVDVGFSPDSARRLTVDAESGMARLRLGSLASDSPVVDRTVDASLRLWVGEALTLLAQMPAEKVAVAPMPLANHADEAVVSYEDDDFVVVRSKPSNAGFSQPNENESDEADEEEREAPRRIVTQQIIDYSYIHEIAEDPAYRWFAISCTAHHEEQLVNVLSAQLEAERMLNDVPVLVFPHRLEIAKGRRTSTKRVPLIEHGYVFALMKPDTDLQHYLNNHGALLLDEELRPDWLEKIILHKAQEPASAPNKQVCEDQQVLIVDGLLKGQMGRIRSFDSAKQHARIEVDFVSKIMLFSIPLNQVVPA